MSSKINLPLLKLKALSQATQTQAENKIFAYARGVHIFKQHFSLRGSYVCQKEHIKADLKLKGAIQEAHTLVVIPTIIVTHCNIIFNIPCIFSTGSAIAVQESSNRLYNHPDVNVAC